LDAAESPEQPVNASSNVVNTAMESRFMVASPSQQLGQHMHLIRRIDGSPRMLVCRA